MKLGDRVMILGRGTSFEGWEGELVRFDAASDKFWVRFDGEAADKAVPFGRDYLRVVTTAEPHIVAGE